MSAVKKWYIGVYGGEAQARPCSPAKFEVIRDRDRRYFVVEDDFDRVTAERDALQRELDQQKSYVEINANSAQGKHREAMQYRAERDALQQRLTAADEELDRAGSQYINKNADCTWSQDASGLWNSTCGVSWAFMDGSPQSHGMHFCHGCGKALVLNDEGEGDE